MKDGSRLLRERLAAGETIVAPGVYDAISARIMENLGFACAFVSGHGVSVATVGKPDAGLVTLSEMVDSTRHVVHAVSIPVLVDGDTGYGGLVNVRRTIEEYRALGVAGVQLEDQVFPKRCGYVGGGGLVPVLEMQRRVAVAVEAGQKSGLIIIARTEARMVDSFAEALARARAYRAAGADWIFVNGLSTREQALMCAEQINGPLVYNFSGTGGDPFDHIADIITSGFRVVLLPNLALRAAVRAVFELMRAVKQSGDYGAVLEKIYDFEEWKALTGINDVLAFEEAANRARFDCS